MSNTKAQLWILCKIQDLMLQKQKMTNELESIPCELISANKIIEQYESDLKNEEEILKNLEYKYKKNDTELVYHNLNISKSRDKLNLVKSNKEYQSTLKEIDILRQKQSDIETLILLCLEEIDNTEKSINKKRKLLFISKEKLLSKKTKIMEKETIIKDSIKVLDKKIIDLRSSVNPNIISVFDNVAKKVKGISIAFVENSVCTGCNMSIPPQLSNELQRFDKLQFCPYCRKIIYWNG